jgi:hypothetical protein
LTGPPPRSGLTPSTVKSCDGEFIRISLTYVFEKVVSEIIRCRPKITLQLLPNAIGNYFKLMEHDYVLRL